MNYNDLKKIAEQRKIMIKDIALSLGFSQNGLKVSIVNGTMPYTKVPDLCRLLNISISDFYDSTSDVVNQTIHGGVSGVVTGIDRRQYYSDSPDVLKAQVDLLEERIKEKDSQIKEKDSQIKDLLTILKGAK